MKPKLWFLVAALSLCGCSGCLSYNEAAADLVNDANAAIVSTNSVIEASR